MSKKDIYINPEAFFLGQISAVIYDHNGTCLGYTAPVDIPKNASKDEIDTMQQTALNQAKRGNYIRY